MAQLAGLLLDFDNMGGREATKYVDNFIRKYKPF